MRKRPGRLEGDRERLESWAQRLDHHFATVVRYMGIGLMIYAAAVDRGRNPALIPAATGMIFFKTLYIYGDRKKDDE